jgi:hypothetical protein
VPRPRSESELNPWMPLLVLLVLVVRPVLPCRAGNSASVVNRLGLAAFSRSAAFRLVVGVGWVKPRAAMREPEMRTTLPSAEGTAVPAAWGGVAWLASWAAGWAASAGAGAAWVSCA